MCISTQKLTFASFIAQKKVALILFFVYAALFICLKKGNLGKAENNMEKKGDEEK